MSEIRQARFYQVLFAIFLCIYIATGIKTEYLYATTFSTPGNLFEDFGYYQRALNDAIARKDAYSIRSIGPGYLYPPPALFIIEVFHYIKPFFVKVLAYSAFNIALMLIIINGIARYYGYSVKRVWYWYVLCLGFAPFFELIHMGQINVITMFGIFMLFFCVDSSSILSGFGLSLAILTKVSPIVFLGYLAANKKFKSITATIVWMGIFIILSIFRYGISPVLEYPKVFQWLSNQFPIDNNSQSLVSKLVMEFGFAFRNSDYHIIQRVLTAYIILIIVTSILLTLGGKQQKEPLFIITAFGMTILPNVMWYHHYVFILLPVLIWMGWKRLDVRVVTWCLLGLIITQIDRFYLTYGLLIQLFIHVSILFILFWQTQQFCSFRKIQNITPV
jgi:hypothetical protein